MLAIVIPYYKITFFEETLKSLASQTDKRFKVYIGDDASPENPQSLLQKYQSSFDFDYHKFETNLGGTSLVKQWERCMAMAGEEDWIMILGDDDVLESNCVEAFYQNLNEIKELQISVVRFATKVVNNKGEFISILHTHPKLENSTDFLIRKLKGGTRSTLSEYIFNKKVADAIRFKDLPLAWYSDLLAVLEFSEFGLIYTINEAVVHFRLSGINITSKDDNLQIKNSATFNFYYYLLNRKKEYFTLDQSDVLLERLEKTFLDNKKNIYFCLQYTKLCITNFYFKRYLFFVRKFFRAVFFKRIANHG